MSTSKKKDYTTKHVQQRKERLFQRITQHVWWQWSCSRLEETSYLLITFQKYDVNQHEPAVHNPLSILILTSTVGSLMRENLADRLPWWKTNLMRDHQTTDHPDERPSWWQTTLMTDHRPPWWQTTLMTDNPDDRPPLMTDHRNDRPVRLPWWETTLVRDHPDDTLP